MLYNIIATHPFLIRSKHSNTHINHDNRLHIGLVHRKLFGFVFNFYRFVNCSRIFDMAESRGSQEKKKHELK